MSDSTTVPDREPGDAALGAYQAVLLEILYAGGPADQMADDIVGAATRGELSLGAIDPALIMVASELTRSWGRLS